MKALRLGFPWQSGGLLLGLLLWSFLPAPSASQDLARQLYALETSVPDSQRRIASSVRSAAQLVAQRGVAVTLSGHTHHGQFSIPSKGWSLASVFLEYAMGTYERNGSLLYVSPGTNFWGIPFRIGALPEVTVVTLKA